MRIGPSSTPHVTDVSTGSAFLFFPYELMGVGSHGTHVTESGRGHQLEEVKRGDAGAGGS